MVEPAWRVFVIGAPFGTGNILAAHNISRAIKELSPQTVVHVLNSHFPEDHYLTRILKFGYMQVIKRCPQVFNYFYHNIDNPYHNRYIDACLSSYRNRYLDVSIKQFKPEVIVVTHPWPMWPPRLIKDTYGSPANLVAVVTDFSVHPSWINPEVDLYFVANQESSQTLTKSGISPNRVIVSGIPIAKEFASSMNKKEARYSLGLSFTMPVLLIMGGGLGIGSLADIMKKLNDLNNSLQVIFVTGTNKKLFKELQLLGKSSRHNVKVVGYTRNVYRLMTAADLLISKPGGLTCSEALAMNLPLVIFNPIAGHEEENAVYLEENGLAYWAKDADELIQVLSRLNNSFPEDPFWVTKVLPGINLDKMQSVAHPLAAQIIADTILNIGVEPI